MRWPKTPLLCRYACKANLVNTGRATLVPGRGGIPCFIPSHAAFKDPDGIKPYLLNKKVTYGPNAEAPECVMQLSDAMATIPRGIRAKFEESVIVDSFHVVIYSTAKNNRTAGKQQVEVRRPLGAIFSIVRPSDYFIVPAHRSECA